MPPKPILLTGSNRSGTTWTGKMIASSDEVFYVEEPFNCLINKKKEFDSMSFYKTLSFCNQ